MRLRRHKYSGTNASPTNRPILPSSAFHSLLVSLLKVDMQEYAVLSPNNEIAGNIPTRTYSRKLVMQLWEFNKIYLPQKRS